MCPPADRPPSSREAPPPARVGDDTIEVPGREVVRGNDKTIGFEPGAPEIPPSAAPPVVAVLGSGDDEKTTRMADHAVHDSTVAFDLVRKHDEGFPSPTTADSTSAPPPSTPSITAPQTPGARATADAARRATWIVAIVAVVGAVAVALAFGVRPSGRSTATNASRAARGTSRHVVAAATGPNGTLQPVATVVGPRDAGVAAPTRTWPPALLNPTAHLRMAWDLALGRPNAREVLFTFDDGPNPGTTDRLLGILDRFHVHAVFFVCGWRLEAEEPLRSRARAILRDARARGHVIGNHTVHHRNLAALGADQIAREIDHNADLIHEVLGERPHLFRPPYGSYSDDVRRMTVERNLELSLWSVDSHDWQRVGDAQGVAMNVITLLGNMAGGTVLLHDTHPWSVRAAQLILQWLETENRDRAAHHRATYRVVDAAAFIEGARERIPTIQAEIAAAERNPRRGSRAARELPDASAAMGGGDDPDASMAATPSATTSSTRDTRSTDAGTDATTVAPAHRSETRDASTPAVVPASDAATATQGR